MPENVTDLQKLRDSITFMTRASKTYRAQVKEARDRQAQLERESPDTTLPSDSLKGDTTPFRPT